MLVRNTRIVGGVDDRTQDCQVRYRPYGAWKFA
jgi:hypothetical protein